MMESKDDRYMRMALGEAERAFGRGEIPVGVVLECGGVVIARAHNLTETLRDVTAHAELQVVSSAKEIVGGKFLEGCAMYVTLEPCVMCAGALYWSRIGRVVIGARDEKRGFLNAGVRLHPRTEVVWGVLEAECREVMVRFFEGKR